jgi:hypothetical protein
LCKRQYKNFITLHKEIIEKKNSKVGKCYFFTIKNDILYDLITMHKCHVFLTVVETLNFITNKNKSKTVSKYSKLYMELNVRIAIPQLVDNKQVYKEIPPVLVLSGFIPAPNQN